MCNVCVAGCTVVMIKYEYKISTQINETKRRKRNETNGTMTITIIITTHERR